MSSNGEIREQVRAFILKQFPLARRASLDDNKSLVDCGIIDSMGVLEIVTFLESTFDIVLDDDEVASDTFESIGSLATLVEQKLNITCRN